MLGRIDSSRLQQSEWRTMMLSDAVSSLRWIVDAILKRHNESSQVKKQKWIQVADYLDNVAKLIDSTVVDFKNKKIPHGHYSQLYEVGCNIGDVLSQVYPNEGSERYWIGHHYEKAFYSAVHLIEKGDGMVLESATDPFGEEGQDVLADLEAAAGKFRGLAMTIRATS
jgi:hypothetical protein